MTERFSSVKVAAEQYATRGFRLVPLYGVDADGLCRCSDPKCKARDAGKHEPPETKDQWKSGRIFTPPNFTEEMNIGLAMGPWSGPGGNDGSWLVALDVDNHDNVAAFFHPRLPPTLTQNTPNGAHFIYRVPAFTPLGNWVNIFGGATMKLDLRYARGRIVVDPSRGSPTRGTGVYQWREWRTPALLPRYALDVIYDLRRAAGRETPDQWDRGDKEP